MKETKEYLDSENVRIGRIVAWCIFGIVFVFFSSISGCVIHNNSVKADKIRATAEKIKAENQITIDQNKAIQELIEMNINPIAARCAIVGFEDTDLCGAFLEPNEHIMK